MSPTFFWTVLSIQCATYGVLGIALLLKGNWQFGVAQLLLMAVQAIIYSTGAPK